MSRRRCCPASEEAALSFDGAVRNLRRSGARPGPGRRHRRRLDRADPRRVRRPRSTARTRWTSARSGCTSGTCSSDPPTAAEVAACVADIDAPPRRVPRSPPARRRDRRRRRRHRHLRSPPGVLDLPAYDRDAIDQARAAGRPTCTAIVDRLVGDAGRGAAGAAVAAPRPGRRDRRRGADPVARAAPYRRSSTWSSPSPTSSTGSPGPSYESRVAGVPATRDHAPADRRADRRRRAPALGTDPRAGALRDPAGPGRAGREGQARRARDRAVQRGGAAWRCTDSRAS